ncbi:MAG TPA: heparinase II/III family protein, partial [Candidatus Glassbacteria bacterium]|nr:heparinase II/III family protein [Candidatus Glassbacteria bacterium]
NWPWLGDELKGKIEAALGRFVDSYPDWLNDGRLDLTTAQAILDSPQRPSFEHNIPTIAMLARALAARISGHPLAARIEKHAEALAEAQLEMRSQGHTEAVSYDGYILDFVADWLPGASAEVRDKLLGHPELAVMLDQSWLMSAPGNLLNVAPFNDVEAREMPFHASAHAKLLALRDDPRSRWFLAGCPLDWLRSDALAAIASLPERQSPAGPEPGALEGLYTMILRSGWDSTDVAVAISATNAGVGHIQNDKGTIVIGTGGDWLIDDPGYQQYVPGLEREFTLGPTAHNYPVLNGVTQKANRVKRLDCSERDGLLHLAVDITGGFDPDSLSLERIVRHVWLVESENNT